MVCVIPMPKVKQWENGLYWLFINSLKIPFSQSFCLSTSLDLETLNLYFVFYAFRHIYTVLT